MPPRRLLLAGGGHAHVEVLRRLARHPLRGVQVTLVSPEARHPYTGMLSGYVAGEYALDDLLFPLAELAAGAGATFVAGAVERVDTAERRVLLSDGRALEYDLLSLDVGSGVEAAETLPRDASVFPVRPLGNVVALARALDERTESTRLVVVGGGASGVELALTAQARLARRGIAASPLLLEAAARVLPEAARGVARLAGRVLAARGVEVRTHTRVTVVDADTLRTASGDEHAFDVLIWAPGPAPPPLVGASALPHDDDGWLLVDESLRALDRSDVFAAGDVATIRGREWMARTGVYAVREGPALWRSLTAACAGLRLPAFCPQRRYLWILNAGDGTALLARGRLRSHSRWARALKHAIDAKFMRRYRVST